MISIPSSEGLTEIGQDMYGWAEDLFPICRSITGPGVRETLAYLKNIFPELNVHEIATGEKAFDWTVPDEWTMRSGYVEDEDGNRVIDFADNNLHVVSYSEPVDTWMDLDELQTHLHSLPSRPDAIPYVTSYYKRSWGFCLTQTARDQLKPGKYHVVIDADLKPGVLNYADAILPGETDEEILISSYFCHPSMANNELSGPMVLTALGRWLSQQKNRRYTYRFVLIPETIGSVIYLSQNLERMKDKTIAGFVLSSVGDDRDYTMIRSRHGDTLTDRALSHTLNSTVESHSDFSFLKRGSDERNYCAPGVDLPVCVISRTRFADYPEYHTSDDDLSVVSPTGLGGGFEIAVKTLQLLEANKTYQATVLGEPQLGPRGLYPDVSTMESGFIVKAMMDILAYADGTMDVIDMAETIGVKAGDCLDIVENLHSAGLLDVIEQGKEK